MGPWKPPPLPWPNPRYVPVFDHGPSGHGHSSIRNDLRPRPGPGSRSVRYSLRLRPGAQRHRSQVGQGLSQITTRAHAGPITARLETVSDLGQVRSGPGHSLVAWLGTISDFDQGPSGPGHSLAMNCMRPLPGSQGPADQVTARAGTIPDLGQGPSGSSQSQVGSYHDHGGIGPGHRSVRDCLRRQPGPNRTRS